MVKESTGITMAVSQLVPARFLCLIAHLVVTITILWSRDANVRACLPLSFTQSEYDNIDTGLLSGLIVTLILLFLELVGFLSGVSMFIHSAGLLSTLAHASGAVALSYFLFNEWPCDIFWYIFGFCSVFPALVEVIVLIGVLGLKRVG